VTLITNTNSRQIMVLTSIDDLPKLDKLTNGITGYLNYRYDEKQEPSGLSSGDTCS